MQVFSETAHSSQTKLIGYDLLVSKQGIGYSNLTPDPQGAWGALGVKVQASTNQKTSLTKAHEPFSVYKIKNAAGMKIEYVSLIFVELT